MCCSRTFHSFFSTKLSCVYLKAFRATSPFKPERLYIRYLSSKSLETFIICYDRFYQISRKSIKQNWMENLPTLFINPINKFPALTEAVIRKIHWGWSALSFVRYIVKSSLKVSHCLFLRDTREVWLTLLEVTWNFHQVVKK